MKLFGNSKGGKWAGSSDKQRRFDFNDIPTDSMQTEPEQELEPIIRSVISKTEVDLTADQPVAVRRKQTLPQETPQSAADTQNHYKPLHQPQPATEPEQGEEAEGMAGWVKGLILLTVCLAIFITILVLVGNQLMSLTALATALLR